MPQERICNFPGINLIFAILDLSLDCRYPGAIQIREGGEGLFEPFQELGATGEFNGIVRRFLRI